MFVYALVSRKLTLSRNLAFSALVLPSRFAILPRIIFGSAYADMRLVPYLMAVALLAIRFRGAPDRRMAHVLAVLGLLFFATRTAANTRQPGDGRPTTSRPSSHAIDRMPIGARVITLTGMPCSEYWPLLRNSHLGAMVIVRREGFSNDQWLMEGRESARPQISRAPAISPPTRRSWCGRSAAATGCTGTIDQSLASLPRNDFDYVWLIDVPPYDPKIDRRHARGLARAGQHPLSDCIHDQPALSIVVPCFNEEGCLGQLHERLTAAARNAVGEDYEIVLVNDGSRDATWPMMREHGRRRPRMSSRSTCRATTATSWR